MKTKTASVWLALAIAGLLCASAAAAPYKAPPGAQDGQVNFAAQDSVLQLDSALSPYHGPGGGQSGCSDWYMMSTVNDSIRPATRVLQAGQTAESGLRIIPLSTRPQIGQVATSDSGVYVERVSAYGRRAYRVTIPPATPVALAICFANAGKPPSLLAWTEPALSQHNRSLAIFIAAVAGLIAASALIGAGLAAISGHAPPRWAALTLFMVLLTRLSATGMFDASVVTPIGGPFGLMAALAGLTLAAGVKLADTIAPLREAWPHYQPALRWSLIGVVALSVLAYLGIPAATVLTDFAVVVGSCLVAAYLVERGRSGSKAARVAAPSAAVFALVTFAAALTTLIGLSDSLIAGDVAGGFAAAGAILLALAVAAGEGIAAPLSLRSARLRGDHSHAPWQAGSILSGAPAADAIASSHQAIFDLDLLENVLTLSREGAWILGLDEQDVTQSQDAWFGRIHPDDRELYRRALADYAAHPGIAFRVEFRARNESGRYHWIELRASMLGDGERAARCLGLMADVTARKESEAAQVGRALHDSLTGLGNRIAMMEELDAMGPGFAQSIFAILDIDRFKTIHASLGDSGGDAVLVEIGKRLSVRFSDLARIYRVGGDSFALLFPRGEPEAIGAELVDTCNEPVSLDGRSVFVTGSVGVTRAELAFDPLELLKHAELALMQAKRHGGACARVYGHELEALAPGDAVVLESELRRALDERQLDVFYQPIVRLSDSTLAGFEALLRWNHPLRGLVSPGDFIGHAEETGLIVALGRFALERAAHELSHWQRFFPLTPALFVSVNVSRRQLRDPEFEPFVTKLLSTGDIKRGTLKLEITESAIATDDAAHEMLRRLRFLPGAGLSIDDFGTGASSLSQLKDLPFDTVKIDKSFLARHGGTHEEEEGSVVLSSIVSLAHDLKRSVVVEGVENASDAEWLKGLGCEFAQGFFFSVPLPANEALEYIAHHFDPAAAQAPPPMASEDQASSNAGSGAAGLD